LMTVIRRIDPKLLYLCETVWKLVGIPAVSPVEGTPLQALPARQASDSKALPVLQSSNNSNSDVQMLDSVSSNDGRLS
jgi:hypothetical protein